VIIRSYDDWINKKTVRYLELAVDEAKMSRCNVRVGAILVNKNRIISCGYNSIKTHPKIELYKNFRINNKGQFIGKASCHAEFMAVRNIDHLELRKSVLYVARLRRDDSLAPAVPCSMCMKLLSDSEIMEIRCT